MSNLMSPNGRARKTLADQIDRLDRVLDGLAEGLNEAVAQEVQRAVGRAVREVVQAAIQEVLTNPELAARLRPGERRTQLRHLAVPSSAGDAARCPGGSPAAFRSGSRTGWPSLRRTG